MLQNRLCMLAQTKLLSVITLSAYFEITVNRFASKVRASANWYLLCKWVDFKIHFGQIRLLNSYPQQHNIVLLTLRKPVILKFGWWDGRRIIVACCGLNLSTSSPPPTRYTSPSLSFDHAIWQTHSLSMSLCNCCLYEWVDQPILMR